MPPRFLVIRWSGMGDVVMALPALAFLRHHFAHSHITGFCDAAFSRIFQASGLCDDILCIDRQALKSPGRRGHGLAGAAGLVPRLVARRYDAAFDLQGFGETAVCAALSGARVIYIFTHDSIGLGEDGPTHQPVEHLAALRSIPGLVDLRPADAAETAEAWRIALNADGPAALILSRQKVPPVDRSVHPAASSIERGAYVLAETGYDQSAIIMASGSVMNVGDQ